MMAMERVAMVVVLQQQQRLCLEAQRNEVRVCCATAPQLWSLRPAGQGREGDSQSASAGRDESPAVEWITAERVTKQTRRLQSVLGTRPRSSTVGCETDFYNHRRSIVIHLTENFLFLLFIAKKKFVCY
jgi:hypothetical protein